MYPLGLLLALSKSVPAWTSIGLPPSGAAGVDWVPVISYQRPPLRSAEVETPDEFTPTVCAVHRLSAPVILFLRICAFMRRVSPGTFTFVVEPEAGWLNPGVLRGSVRVRGVPEYPGVP